MEQDGDAIWRGLIESLVAGIAHDLNGRLTALAGVAYIARSTTRLDDDLLEILDDQVARLTDSIRLLRSLPLDFGRGAEPLRLRDIVAETTRLYCVRSGPEPPELAVSGDGSVVVEAPAATLAEILLLVFAAAEPRTETRAGKLSVVYGVEGANAFVRVATVPEHASFGRVEARPGARRTADMEAALNGAARLAQRLGGHLVHNATDAGTDTYELGLPAMTT